MSQYEYRLDEIKERIFKGSDGWNNYMNVSIDEMDWLVEQVEKYEKLKELNFNNKFHKLMYGLIKLAANDSFIDFLENWDLSEEDYDLISDVLEEIVGIRLYM